jgi:hypothetical protein
MQQGGRSGKVQQAQITGAWPNQKAGHCAWQSHPNPDKAKPTKAPGPAKQRSKSFPNQTAKASRPASHGSISPPDPNQTSQSSWGRRAGNPQRPWQIHISTRQPGTAPGKAEPAQAAWRQAQQGLANPPGTEPGRAKPLKSPKRQNSEKQSPQASGLAKPNQRGGDGQPEPIQPKPAQTGRRRVRQSQASASRDDGQSRASPSRQPGPTTVCLGKLGCAGPKAWVLRLAGFCRARQLLGCLGWLGCAGPSTWPRRLATHCQNRRLAWLTGLGWLALG